MILQYDDYTYLDDSPTIGPSDMGPEAWLYAGMACLVLILILVFGQKIVNYLAQGSFRPNKKFNRDSLYDAYIHLGGAMIRADKKDAREKLQYTQKYTRRYFPNQDDDIAFDFNHAIKNEANIKQICAWLNNHLNRAQKLQTLYFLAGMSMVDGSMNSRESKLLRDVCFYLELTQKDYESTIAMYTQRRKRTESKSKTTGSYSRKSALKVSCEILGVSEHASMGEIKKAYRKMVKLHHPDRFATSSESEQKIAQERFIEIQNAYETIEKLK